MGIDLQRQKPWTTNQISNEKPNVERSFNELTGYLAGGMNGGHNNVIYWKQVMAGEKHQEMKIRLCMQMLTPLTPAYQNLKCTVRSYFVPDSRIWVNSEKFEAQNGGTTEDKIETVPNTGGKMVWIVQDPTEDKQTLATNTTLWRDTFIGQYYPRIGEYGLEMRDNPNKQIPSYIPTVDISLLRGRVAIYNDFERNKELDPEMYEYNSDTVSNSEWQSYTGEQCFAKNTMRAKKDNSYYSDYRIEMQGIEDQKPNTTDAGKELLEWAQWESKIAEARSQAENAQMNPWDVISKIRGSKKLTEGKVQLIGQKTFNMNYSAITQNAYNTNQDIPEEFQVMGKQGAYSYTEIEIPAYAGMIFNESGYVHIIATITADTVFETGWDRLLLNVRAMDRYRPDMKDDKLDVLYEIEQGKGNPGTADFTAVSGFKRKYSEYFKMPNLITGDMTTNNYFEIKDVGEGAPGQIELDSTTEVISQKTYQFFQTDCEKWLDYDSNVFYNIAKHKDYTDLLINRNQAVKQTIEQFISLDENSTNLYTDLKVKGNQQVIYVGIAKCYAELPIIDEIKSNYTTFGEH